jgi:hypothetical protein
LAMLFEIIAVACDWPDNADTPVNSDPNKLIVSSF